jgi:hypothetical protein
LGASAFYSAGALARFALWSVRRSKEGWLMLREWRIVILVGIVCLGVGIVFGRMTSSGSRKSDVSVDSKTYATCMALWRDEADCAEVMKRLNAWTHETPN